MKDSKFGFSMQLEESTDITNNAQLPVYVRYTTQDNDVKTELLMSKELSSTTKRKDVFEVLDNFFKQSELDRKKFIDCTTDGVPPCWDVNLGLQLSENYFIKRSHCSLLYT